MTTKAEQQTKNVVQGVATRLRYWRRQRGMTLSDLASASGIHKGNLSRIEAGRAATALGTLSRLAEALSVPITAFLSDAPRSAPEHDTSMPLEVPPVVELANERDENRPFEFTFCVTRDDMVPHFERGNLLKVRTDLTPELGDLVLARQGSAVLAFKVRSLRDGEGTSSGTYWEPIPSALVPGDLKNDTNLSAVLIGVVDRVLRPRESLQRQL